MLLLTGGVMARGKHDPALAEWRPGAGGCPTSPAGHRLAARQSAPPSWVKLSCVASPPGNEPDTSEGAHVRHQQTMTRLPGRYRRRLGHGPGLGAAVWAATAAAARRPREAAPGCATSALSVWVDATQSDGAAGTIAFALEITNRGGHACTLKGYPGVSATTLAAGSSATRRPPAGLPGRPVTLAAGATAHADLFYHDVEVSTSGCSGAASLIKVYPPNSKTSKTGFFSLPVCTVKNHGTFSVSVIRSGSKLDV